MPDNKIKEVIEVLTNKLEKKKLNSKYYQHEYMTEEIDALSFAINVLERLTTNKLKEIIIKNASASYKTIGYIVDEKRLAQAILTELLKEER